MKYVDFQNCIHVSGYKNINFDEVVVFSVMYTWFKLYKYLFAWSTLISRNVYLFHGIKLLILKKFVDIKKYIPVSRNENINFDEVVVFPEMYTWFKLYKSQFWWSMVISRNVYLFHGIKILILKNFVDINKYIPVSRYENINFDEVVVFPEMYTWFELYKYLFSSSTLISRIVYTFQVTKISILMMYVEFLKWIPVSRDQNINFEEVRWFPEMYTCFRL